MLAIRLQRTGRSGHAQFRVIVQDSRFSPKRGRIVSYLGSYNPHTKAAVIDSEKAAQYLSNGAQPSDTVARLFKKEGIKLPAWVEFDEPKKRTVRNPEKRRSTAPAKPEAPAAPAQPSAEAEPEPETTETKADTKETPTESIPEQPAAEETTAEEEKPAESTESPADESPAAEETTAEPESEEKAAES